MASENINTNDPSTWQVINTESERVHLAIAGTFDGASVALEQEINGNVYPCLDGSGVAIVFTAAADNSVLVSAGDKIRLNPTGGGGSMNIDFNIAGAKLASII